MSIEIFILGGYMPIIYRKKQVPRFIARIISRIIVMQGGNDREIRQLAKEPIFSFKKRKFSEKPKEETS